MILQQKSNISSIAFTFWYFVEVQLESSRSPVGRDMKKYVKCLFGKIVEIW